jgi:thioredoxin-like negative regulator of GroEL
LFTFGCQRRTHTDNAPTAVPSPTRTAPPRQTRFTLHDVDGRTTSLTLQKGHLEIGRVTQPKILLHFFTTQADVCRAMLPYLSDLQRKNAQSLFVLGVVVPDGPDAKRLRTFMEQNDATFFIAEGSDNNALMRTVAADLSLEENYPLPLTVLFDRGHYVTHYEGVVPIEMIRHDLDRNHTHSTKEIRP